MIDAAKLPHPRLLVRSGELARLRQRVENDTFLKGVAEAVRRDADAMLGVPPIERVLEGRRLLGESRRAVRRMLTLSMAYHLTGKAAYVDRAAKEMLAIAKFSDWNPSHYLDVAEMTFAMAIGYDWLYDQLDPATRATIRDAILHKGVRVPLDTRFNSWTRASNNWGQVCHAGMVAGALAVLEDDHDAAVQTVQRAVTNVPRSMAAFAPSGSYPEGPGYWAYGTTYNVLLIAMLESTLGRSFGLAQAPGFDKTGAYPALTTGPSGLTFNYADGSSGRGIEPALYWFAARYSRPDWLTGDELNLRKRLAEPAKGTSGSDRFLPLMLLWASGKPAISTVNLPLNWTSDSDVPVAIHRTSWTDTNAVFVGIKAGSPSSSHAHMDIGSFVMDADGVRWATDLGAESYHRIESRGMDFWSMKQDSQRWTVFRQSSLSHNTLVIDGALQRVAGHSKIVRFSNSPAFPHSVVDMSAAYAGQAGAVQRGIALLPGGAVLVRDHLTGLKPGASVRWGMVTPGKPGKTGTSEMELRQDKASLQVTIIQPANMVWTSLDTAIPKNEWDTRNSGTMMAAFTANAPASGELDLAVLLVPGSAPKGGANQINPAPPLEWSAAR